MDFGTFYLGDDGQYVTGWQKKGEKEYYYLRALNLLDSDAYDNTLSEPIAFPSNVNGGTGMVGFSTETNYMLTVKNNAVPPMVPDL